MKTFLITEQKIKDILHMYYQLNEGGVDQAVKNIGIAARKLLKNSQDDIMKFFETQAGRAIVADIDNVVASATKNKNIDELERMEKMVYHWMNDGRGDHGNVSVEFEKFMNTYARSKGKGSWGAIRDEVTGTPRVNPSGAARAAGAAGWGGGGLSSKSRFSGADFTNKTNYNNQEQFNRVMSMDAERIIRGYKNLSNGWDYISAKGFEKYGITDMRKWLRQNVKEIRWANPEANEWEIVLKDVITPA